MTLFKKGENLDLSALSLVIFATFCWSLAQITGKVALRNMGALLFNSIRFSVVAPIIILGIFATGGLGSLGNSWAVTVALISAFFGFFLHTYLFFLAIKREAANRVIPVGNSSPFWVIALSPIFLGEELSLILPVSAVLIFAGSYLLNPGKKEPSRWRLGVFVASFSAFLWGVGDVMSKFCLNSGMTTSALLLIRTLFTAVLFDIIVFARKGEGILKTDRRSIGLSALSGILAYLVGNIAFFVALSIENVSRLAPISGTTIFFGFLFSVFLLGEKPTSKSIFGTILILAGLLFMAFG